MKYIDLSCVRCGKQFTSDGPADWGDSPPNGGVIFTSRGNYGSAVYDEPMGSSNYILVIICDACLTGNTGNVMHVQTVRKVVRDDYTVVTTVADRRTPWDPEKDDLEYERG
jgi:hypothetical protein